MTDDREGGAWLGSRAWPLWVVGLLIVAALPRLIAIGDDFWLDEIWSLRFAGVMQSPLDVLFRAELQHDNNHPLNTLWLYALGESDGWIAYRVPALVAGLAAVALAIVAGARRSRVEGLVAGLLFATSYLMIAYSTEARGYSLAITFALAAMLLFERAAERPGWWPVAGFWIAAMLGFLSHLSFGHAYFALLGWSAWRVLCSAGERRTQAVRLAALHLVPLAFLVALYLVFVRGMQIGGGPTLSVVEVLTRTVTWTLGGPVNPVVALVSGGAVVAALVTNTVWSRRAGSDRWVFDVAAIVVAPAATLVVLRPEFLAPRYFLLAVTFFLLVWARVVARLLVNRRLWIAGCALLVLYVGANAIHVVPFLRLGKGEYTAALQYMAAHTAGETISVARYPDTASPMILQYHSRRPLSGKQVKYFRHTRLPRGGVEWYVVNVQLGQPEPAPRLRLGQHGYELAAKFDYSAPGGLGWWVYRRL